MSEVRKENKGFTACEESTQNVRCKEKEKAGLIKDILASKIGRKSIKLIPKTTAKLRASKRSNEKEVTRKIYKSFESYEQKVAIRTLLQEHDKFLVETNVNYHQKRFAKKIYGWLQLQ